MNHGDYFTTLEFYHIEVSLFVLRCYPWSRQVYSSGTKKRREMSLPILYLALEKP